MRTKLGLLLVLATLCAVVATAQAATRTAKAVTVSLSGWSSGPDEDALLQQVVNEFQKTHPNIKVDYSVINGDYTTAMTARFAAHNPPDVFYVDSSVAPTDFFPRTCLALETPKRARTCTRRSRFRSIHKRGESSLDRRGHRKSCRSIMEAGVTGFE